MLVLAGGDRMTLAAARQLEALVKAGATVLGHRKPIGSPGLEDGAAGDAEVRRIADELLGPGYSRRRGRTQDRARYNPLGPVARRRVGAARHPKGFRGRGCGPWTFFTPIGRAAKTTFTFSRIMAMRQRRSTGNFRADHGTPQAWDPETGSISALPGAVRKGPVTAVPIQLESNQSLFRRLP